MFCIQFLSKLETQSIAFFSQRPQRVHSWLKDNFSELDTCVSVQNWKTIIKDKTKQNRHTLQVSGASQGNSFVLWLRCDCFSRVGTMHGSPRLPTSGLLFHPCHPSPKWNFFSPCQVVSSTFLELIGTMLIQCKACNYQSHFFSTDQWLLSLQFKWGGGGTQL